MRKQKNKKKISKKLLNKNRRMDYRDRLFRFIFKDKKDLLELYNTMNGTSYTNPEDVTITTIEDVIYITMKNDLSFILGYDLNLYEHQSTYNPNMPIRGVSYFAVQYEDYIAKNKINVFTTSKVMLPRPKYVVFYYGSREMPDKTELRLSDLYYGDDDGSEPALECIATMLNLNYGHNEEILAKNKKLGDYTYFLNKVSEYRAGNYEITEAIKLAMDDCIRDNVLKDVFEHFENEVFRMFLTEFDEKVYHDGVYNDGYVDGIKESQDIIDEKDRQLSETKIELTETQTELTETKTELTETKVALSEKDRQLAESQKEIERLKALLESK